MFEKLVAIEPVSLIPSAEEELHRYAKEVVLYQMCIRDSYHTSTDYILGLTDNSAPPVPRKA